jgi:hypothetical protein
MSPTGQDRLTLIRTIEADPPQVHQGAPAGVWCTSSKCYEFIAQHLADDSVTLETGLGISTVLFSLWSKDHTCVVGSGEQVDALRSFMQVHDYSTENVHFGFGMSERVLPSLSLEPLDLFLIDGGHGFPLPVIGWYYGSQTLRAGGIVVIQLTSVDDFLVRSLRLDPRWTLVGGDHKWLALRKEGEFSLSEEWMQQSFLGPRRQPASTRNKSAVYRSLTKFTTTGMS